MLFRTVKFTLLFSIASLASIASAAPAPYPQEPIRIVVPWPAGGAGDFLARIVAQRMSIKLSQSVVVENRAGASTNIGTMYVARSKPDGYTLLLASSNNTVNTSLFPKLKLNFIKDFKPISNVGLAPNVLVVPENSPVRSMQELIQLAKAKPDVLTYGFSGYGSASQLSAEMFKQVGLKVRGIPYKGSAPAVTDLLGGRLSMMFTVVPTILGNIQAKKLRALCVLSDKRLRALPNVPTSAEVGLPGLKVSIWYGLVAPKNTPDSIVSKLEKTIAEIMKEPKIIEKLTKQGTVPIGDDSSAFAATIAHDTQTYAKLIKSAHISVLN